MIKYIPLSVVYFYRWIIRPLLTPSCRFYPSCSSYSLEAIEEHGALKGSYLTVKRLCRCHPLSDGGFDFVPKKRN
jgi:hypothetical protein